MYRPTATYRKQPDVMKFLTAAVMQYYGLRDDNALPLGAFYDKLWDLKFRRAPDGGIWYIPHDLESLTTLQAEEPILREFCHALINGGEITFDGKTIPFEAIDESMNVLLPQL